MRGRVNNTLSPLHSSGGIMQKVFMSLFAAFVLVGSAFAQDLESEPGKLGYSIGYEFGAELRSYDIDLELESIFQAIRDSYQGTEPQVEIVQKRQLMTELQEQIRQ